MYTQNFYITENVGNNAFSFSDRKNPKLFVPALKKIESFEEINLLTGNSEKITFEEYDFDDVMQQCFGLKNLYEMKWKGKKIYLVDNHNHVFYFWYLARKQGIISDNSLLYHIDEHADTRDPEKYLLKPDSRDLQKVFEYTNFFLNVGNYIIPAEKEGLIGKTIQIRSDDSLKKYVSGDYQKYEKEGRNIILNLDLDFFEPELDYIEYELKKQVILDIAKRADLITVCTSPYFINQERAIEVLRDIFQ
ncbi:hypothetical protein GW846_01105 [Candidatus Gracilibacteria bacterium]|nr:hypothetical protein [Candidatus Gracilibacteria bacterium]